MMNSAYDVIVVGGGNAALCAALSAREQADNVLMLERAPENNRGGNSEVPFYFNYPGSSGLMAGSVFGRIAGRESAAFARSCERSAAG